MLNIESALYVSVQAKDDAAHSGASILPHFAPDMAYRVLDFWKPDGVQQPYLLLSNGAQRSFVPMGRLRAVAFAPAQTVYALPLEALAPDPSIHLHALVVRELSQQSVRRQALGLRTAHPAWH